MPYKRIPANIRQAVWETYIGEDIGKIKCPLCQKNDIKPFQFQCGHVIACSKGGSIDVSNLRPICSVCNSSMYNHNMVDFAQKYYPKAPIHETFKKAESAEIRDHSKSNIKDFPIIPANNSSNIDKPNLIEEKTTQEETLKLDINSRTCPYCGYLFAQRCTLLRHLRNKKCKSMEISNKLKKKQMRKEYQCQHCQKKFNNEDSLNMHQENACLVINLKRLEASVDNLKKLQTNEHKESDLLRFLEEQYLKNNTEKVSAIEKQINELNEAKQKFEKQLAEYELSKKR